MLRSVYLLAGCIPGKAIMDLYDLLEVQFFEVDIHPAHEEVDEVALLELIITHASQCFQHLGQLSIEIIEAAHLLQAFSVLLHELHAASHRKHLRLEGVVGEANTCGLGETEYLAN